MLKLFHQDSTLFLCYDLCKYTKITVSTPSVEISQVPKSSKLELPSLSTKSRNKESRILMAQYTSHASTKEVGQIFNTRKITREEGESGLSF